MTLILRNGHRQEIDEANKAIGLRLYSRKLVAGYIERGIDQPRITLVASGVTRYDLKEGTFFVRE